MNIMNQKARDVIAVNLRALMKHYGLTQMQLSQKAGVHQKTISNILNPDQIKGTATVGSIEKVATAFSMDMWQMCIPNMSLDTLTSRNVSTLIDRYLTSDYLAQKQMMTATEGAIAKDELYSEEEFA